MTVDEDFFIFKSILTVNFRTKLYETRTGLGPFMSKFSMYLKCRIFEFKYKNY